LRGINEVLIVHGRRDLEIRHDCIAATEVAVQIKYRILTFL
jgi:hypothetical protein